jgi:hypothetical protein
MLASSVAAQVRGPGTAVAGGSVAIDVACNQSTIEVTVPGHGTKSYDVPPDRRVVVPVPPVPPGTVLVVAVGSWGALAIEVVAP